MAPRQSRRLLRRVPKRNRIILVGRKGSSGAAIVALLLTFSAAGCLRSEPPPPPADTPAAAPSKAGKDPAKWTLTEAQRAQPLIRVGDDVMTLGFFVDMMGPDLLLWREVNGADSANRKIAETLEGHLVGMLLAKPALAAGHGRLPEATQLRSRLLVDALTRELVQAQGAAFDVVTDEDRQRYHAAHRAEFTTPAALRISHILCDTRAEAQQILDRLLSAADQRAAMAKVGVTRARNLGMFPIDESLPVEPPNDSPKPPVTAALRSAAKTLTVNGEIYPEVVAGPRGFHILKRTGERAERTTPPDRLKATLKRGILAERRQQLLDQLADKLELEADVQYHPEHLEHLRVAP